MVTILTFIINNNNIVIIYRPIQIVVLGRFAMVTQIELNWI